MSSSTLKQRSCVGIVREVYNKWERRAPLCPGHVKELVAKGISVVVQPSNSRVFTNDEYLQAGATVAEDLSSASIIVGVKQVPVNELISDKTYMFFSHTIKGQKDNMDLLSAVLQQNIRLIDYECITETGTRNGARTIAFGAYAGRAGMVDTFRGIGERLLAQGYSTPFLNIASTYMYGGLDQAKLAIEQAGKEISRYGLPQELSPMTFVFTGNGNVSQGAQEMFELMPHQIVDPSDLPNLPNDRKRLYACITTSEHMVEAKHGSDFDRLEYFNYPEKYQSKFHRDILPHSSVVMNCMYWDSRYPRLITNDQIEELYDRGNRKLIGIGDISCDIGVNIAVTPINLIIVS